MTISPFLANLRRQIGHQLLLLPSVSVLVDDPDGRDRILLARHAAGGQWGFVGGMVEPEEHPAIAAARETLEETGLEVEVGELITVAGGPGYTVHYGNGDVTSYVTTVYRARIVGGAERPDGDEIDGLRWFERNELPDTDLGPFATSLLTDLEIL
ncbi:MAG: NUDIX domain-containing protein [Actinomycetota bacterium]